jgi:hypothetical protein
LDAGDVKNKHITEIVVVPLFIILKDNSLAFEFYLLSAAQIHILVEPKIIYF